MGDTGVPFFIDAVDLQAAASVLSFGCSGAAQGFYLAKGEQNAMDPQATPASNYQYVTCVQKMLRLMRMYHADAFVKHKECVSRNTNEPHKCLETQQILDKAMKQRLNRRFG